MSNVLSVPRQSVFANGDSAWRYSAAAVALGLVGLVFIYWVTSASVIEMWARDPFGHGYVILPASIYLGWLRRAELAQLSPRPAFWVLAALALASCVWLTAALTDTTSVQQFSLAVMFIAFIWGALGTNVARTLALALGFLFFALPIGDYVVPTLQQITARFAVTALRFTGVPALQQRELITIPGSSWEVAQACSGINYLMSALVVAYIYAAFTYRTWPYRLTFFFAAVPVALLANGIRVYVTILVASLGAPEIAQGLRHAFVGWLVFAVIVSAMLALSSRLTERSDPQAAAGESAAARVGDSGGAARPWASAVFVAVGLLIVSVAPISASRLESPDQFSRSFDPPAIHATSAWKPVFRDVYEWSPTTDGARAVRSQTFEGPQPVKVSIAYYDALGAAKHLGSAENSIENGPWRDTDRRSRRVTIGAVTRSVSETHLESGSTSLIVWRWYQIDGQTTANEYLLKLLLVKSRLTGSAGPFSQITLVTRDLPGVDTAASLQQFADALAVN